MSEEKLFDRAVAAVRDDVPAGAQAAAARDRVWQRLQGAPASAPATLLAGAPLGSPIRGCADVRALLPAYRARTLPDAQELLVQDHLRECPACQAATAMLGRAYLVAASLPCSRTTPSDPIIRFAGLAAVVLGRAGAVDADLNEWFRPGRRDACDPAPLMMLAPSLPSSNPNSMSGTLYLPYRVEGSIL